MALKYRVIHVIPSFRGLHNKRKCQCWIVMLESELSGNQQGLTTRQIVEYMGCSSVPSMLSLLTWWSHWPGVKKFVIRHPHPDFYRWTLADRGRKWLVRWYQFMPLNEYQTEIKVDIPQAINWLQTESMAQQIQNEGVSSNRY